MSHNEINLFYGSVKGNFFPFFFQNQPCLRRLTTNLKGFSASLLCVLSKKKKKEKGIKFRELPLV